MAQREGAVDLSPAAGGGPRPDTEKFTGTTEAGRVAGENAPDIIEGKVTGVSGHAITGWVWSPARPYEALDVEMYVGNAKVGRGRSDLFDLELAKARLGNGMHRFEIGLERLPPGTPPFVLRLVVADTDVEIGPSITLQTVEDAERLLSRNEYRGRITGLKDGMVHGWVVNRRNPHERPTLKLRDGDNTVLVHLAGELASEIVEAGVIANVYRFEMPLPSSLLDGKLHQLSINPGETSGNLEGSPILFGPTDFGSLGRELITMSQRLQKIDRRIEQLAPVTDATLLQNQITTRVLDRIDMLLNIYRDSIERELAVIRRQLARIMHEVPIPEPDVIVASDNTFAIEDVPIPEPATFRLTARAVPLLSFDLTTAPEAGAGEVREMNSRAGLRITGSDAIELGKSVTAPASFVINGTGANDPLEFCEVLASFDGHPMSGRVDVFEDDAWNYVGTTIDGIIDRQGGLCIGPFGSEVSLGNPLAIQNIAVFGHGRAPFDSEGSEPRASIVYLGSERLGSGWYGVETSPHGGICWMGAQSDTHFRLKPARAYVFKIPELRPLSPEIMSELQIFVDGTPATFSVSPLPRNSGAFSVHGECLLPEEPPADLVFRISFPHGSVHSPLELGINNDARPLTVAVRAIALSAGS